METRIAASDTTKVNLNAIGNRSLELIAELQVLELQLKAILQEEIQKLGIGEYVKSYDFNTHEFIVKANIPDLSTEEGRKSVAEFFGVDEVGMIVPGDQSDPTSNQKE